MKEIIMKFKFNVTGIDCPNCAGKLARQIEGKGEITSCQINFISERMTVESELPSDEVLALVKSECRAFSRDIEVSPK